MLGLISALMLHATLTLTPTFHYGPSVSLYELRLNGQVGQLAPGLGVQGSMQLGKWSAGLNLFGSALGLGTANPGATVSLAQYTCYEPWGLCLGPGLDLDGTQGGLLKGFTWKKNFFIVGALHIHM